MIDIVDKKECCGCEACVQVCPEQCISFTSDNEGFNYPTVDRQRCIDCSLCEKVCPVINQNETRQPIEIVAVKNNDLDVRVKSSSGGSFTLLAQNVIEQGGVVFGVRFDEQWDVVHSYVETIADLSLFRGSKYVQSRIGNCFAKVKEFLLNEREVLFSGTPCQVAGLKKFLRKEYDNLLTVDFFCHGVPSPLVWSLYKDEKLATYSQGAKFSDIDFRDKSVSWKRYCVKTSITVNGEQIVNREPAFKNPYIGGFLSDIYLRPSCYHCPSKSLKSSSDITLADFWGIERELPEFEDANGVSLVLVNTEKGATVFGNVECQKMRCTESALQSVLFNSVKAHRNRDRFFRKLSANKFSISNYIEKQIKPTIFERGLHFAKRCARKIISLTKK